MLDATGKSESYRAYGKQYVITRDMLLSGFGALSGRKLVLINKTRRSVYLNYGDFAGLPPTHILTAEFDALADEGEQLHRQLLEAGVDVTCTRYFGVIHGFFQLSAVSSSARQAIAQVAALIKEISLTP